MSANSSSVVLSKSSIWLLIIHHGSLSTVHLWMCRKPWAFSDSVQHFSWTNNKSWLIKWAKVVINTRTHLKILTPKLPSFEEQGELKSWLILPNQRCQCWWKWYLIVFLNIPQEYYSSCNIGETGVILANTMSWSS